MTPKVTEINYTALGKILNDLPDIFYSMKKEKELTLQDISDDTGININTLNKYMNRRQQLATIKTLIIVVNWLEKVRDESSLSIKARLRTARLSHAKSTVSSS